MQGCSKDLLKVCQNLLEILKLHVQTDLYIYVMTDKTGCINYQTGCPKEAQTSLWLPCINGLDRQNDRKVDASHFGC